MPNFDIRASEYDSVSEPQAELAKGLFDLSLDYLPDTRPDLLDIGCGTGHLSIDLAGLFPKSLDCVDISKEMLKVCKEKLQSNFPSLKWRLFENDAESFEPDKKYDAIYCSATIQWFSDVAKFFQRVKTWLKPNGILCIGAFGEKTLCELRDAYFKAAGRQLETKAKFFSLDKFTTDFKILDSAECIYTQSADLKALGKMGVTGTGKKPLTRSEAQKLKEILSGANFSWELRAMVFKAQGTRL